MERIKNISIGFLVSFIGSIPLGYLNLAGLEIYSKSGLHNLVFFLFGVVFVEIFIIYFTLLFAKKLIEKKRLMKIINLFSIVFLFGLAFFFYFNFGQKRTSNNYLKEYLVYSPFVIGAVLNCFNFLQIPFWTSWNLYLINGNFIRAERNLKYYYVAGTSVGTFLGMFSLILLQQSLFFKINQFSELNLSTFIPLFFILLGTIHAVKLFKKANIFQRKDLP